MARVYLISGTLKLVYTIDQAVGSGCPNMRDDVLLVQFFLKVISGGPEKALFTPAGRGPIGTDGIWGPTSQAYLDKFIEVNSGQNPGSPLTKDGRVDPVVGGKIKGSISGHIYTILALNTSFKGVRGVAALLDITTDPLFPKDLRPSLKIIQ
ncbi:MAG: hypothetical protein ABJF23_14005 [Bryobacteraceae bacterium]